MAKILLVSRQLDATTINLAESLYSQQHDVTVLTQQTHEQTNISLNQNISVWNYFRTWSWFEFVRVMPRLWRENFQIFHIVFTGGDLLPAEVGIGLLSKATPQGVLATSLMDLPFDLKTRKKLRLLLRESDIVTCPSVEGMTLLKGLSTRSLRQGRGLLPPMLQWKDESAQAEIPSELAAILKTSARIAMPFDESYFSEGSEILKRAAVLAVQRPILLLGSLSQWSHSDRRKLEQWLQDLGVSRNWMMSGDLTAGQQIGVLAACDALMIAGLPLSPLEVTHYQVKSLKADCTLIIDDRQASIHADLWKNQKNCWILRREEIQREMRELLQKEHLKLPALDQPLQNRNLFDAPLNELSRLYNRALSQQHFS